MNDETELSDGSKVTDDHRELKPDGQQRGYVVLTQAERDKGFVRPVRQVYIHIVCRATIRMATSIAETFARNPKFYSGTYCYNCNKHLPLKEFVWEGTNEMVGS